MKTLLLRRLWTILSFIIILIGLTSCTSPSAVSGRLIVWHTWDEAEAPIIEQLLEDFQRIHPNIQVSVERKDYNNAPNEFGVASLAGLGPDVLIGIESPSAHDLYEKQLIANLTDTNVNWDLFAPVTLKSVQRQGDVRVGVPINAYVSVLFFNRSRIEQPPISFDALKAASEEGVKVGIPTTFFGSYWGITGLGGSVFEDDTLSEDSAADIEAWLEWLIEFQQKPGAVLSPDIRALVDGFERGDIDLLVANSLELATLEEKMGAEAVGVATIPDIPNAQPFSTIELIVVNSASVQMEAASLLANFMSNEAQQRKMARSTSGRAPVNEGVTLNPTLFPQVSIIVEQNQAAVVPTTRQDDLINQLIIHGNPVYQQVLEGLISPRDGAELIVNSVRNEGVGK